MREESRLAPGHVRQVNIFEDKIHAVFLKLSYADVRFKKIVDLHL